MLDELFDRAWHCFSKADRKPPDRGDGDFIRLPPMPDRSKLEAEFKQLLDELDLSAERRRELSEQSAERKWRMIVEQKQRRVGVLLDLGATFQDQSDLVAVVGRLCEWNRIFPDKYALPMAVQTLEALAVALRTETFSFVQQFIDSDGIPLLTRLLASTRNGGDSLALPILSCFKALLNSETARAFVLERSDTLLSVVGALESRSSRCQLLALEILAGLCVVPEGGHHAVLKSLTDATTILGERTRFQTLVDELHREHGAPRDTERIRVALMSLVNALLKSGPSENSLQFRLHLRYELLNLGVQEVIDGLRGAHGTTLEDHLDLFEMMRQEDETEFSSNSSSGSVSPVDVENPAALVETLCHKLDHNVARSHFLSILQHLLMLSLDERHLHLWRLFDLIIQQLSLQLTMNNLEGVDAALDGSILDIDLNQLLSKLKTDQQCERLEKELMEKDKKLMELENRLADLQDGMSLSSFSRSSDLGSGTSESCHSPTPTVSSMNSLPTIRAPPPPPPPPPPPGFGLMPPPAPKKRVPKPLGPLRTLNWTTIPEPKTKGTVWENVNDEKLYDQINLSEICSRFASTTKEMGDQTATMPRRVRAETVPSVIEFRRSQNCTIMLSKLKMQNREIRNAILSMDEKGRLPRDMIEQMLKFVPTKEELTTLDMVLAQHKSPSVLAPADRFLFEVGQIPRYEQRLQCLYIIRTFQERIDEMRPFLCAVSKASTTLMESKRLKQLLSLCLAVGNYLNFGKRSGNAFGFEVRSLDAIRDVRSALKVDRNLLHFLLETIEDQMPDLLRLKRELLPVYEAAKSSGVEMELDLRKIRESVRFVAAELQIHAEQRKRPDGTAEDNGHDSGVDAGSSDKSEKSPKRAADKFGAVVRSFLSTANKEMSALERLNEEMIQKFSKCLLFFGEPNPKIPSDEFFGFFAKFLNQFAEAHGAIIKERDEIEREKRQTMNRTLLVKKCGKKRGHTDTKEIFFDRLVNEVQSAAFFQEDIYRLRQSCRPKGRRSMTPANAAKV